MYLYRLHGLIIQAEMVLPELLHISDFNPDVVIQYGQVPISLEQVTCRDVVYEQNANQFQLTLQGVARYLVSNGKTIVVDPYKDADEQTIRLFLLGSPLAALLHQRGLLVLHGSCIATSKGAVIFVGPSGVGKSTIASAFEQRGYAVLADDISAIALNAKGLPLLQPAYPQLKLLTTALKLLEIAPKALSKVRTELDKYAIPIHSSFCQTPLPIYAIYELIPDNHNRLQIIPLQGGEKLRCLNLNTYYRRLLEGMAKKAENFQLATKLAQNTRISLVRRPIYPFRLNELVNILEQDFSG